MRAPKILCWDIETSYYVHTSWTKWTPGMKLVKEKSIICIAYKWLGEKQTHVISIGDDKKRFAEDPFDDKYVIEKFQEVINQADLAVAHNGDKFDMKFFNSRLLKHGLNPILVKTYDTLKGAKRFFSFHSNRLGEIAKYLGVSKKTRTEMSWWDDILFKNCKKSLKLMEDYCKQDVVVLEDVYKKLLPFIQTGHPTYNALTGIPKDINLCPSCGSQHFVKDGYKVLMTGKYSRYQCQDCGHKFRGKKPIEPELSVQVDIKPVKKPTRRRKK